MMKNFISTILQYVKIVRPVNVLITGCAVVLGAVVALDSHGVAFELATTLLLGVVSDFRATAAIVFVLTLMLSELVRIVVFTAFTAMFAAAYGNVINDIIDVKSDRISHPNRPLVSGKISIRGAYIFAIMLAVLSMICAMLASTFHAIAALVPIILLTLYSKYFKRTPIVGNIIVALLVAYALLYGALPQPETKVLIAPALLAFLLNFCREIVKDVQDAAGDGAAGWRTSAVLPARTIKILLTSSAAFYLLILFVPSLVLNHFGAIYNVICLTIILPIHIYWMTLVIKSGVDKCAGRIGLLLKLEMVAGLVAIGADKFF